jgi:LysM repeat protein
MENNDSNIKPQQTGGLKLMTVFVVVLALHVIVIGGMTTYYLLKGGSSDDMLTDKTSKSAKTATDGTLASDGQMPDPTADKSATASTSTPDTSGDSGASTTSLAPPTDQTPAPETSVVSTTPDAAAASASPVMTIPAPAASPVATASGAQPPIPFHLGQAGPVINPPDALAPAAPAPAPADATADVSAPATTPAPATDANVYVVKAHDSLAKIAHLNHTSVAKLKAANSLNSDLLQIGQKLVIPARAQTAPTAVATATPSVPVNTGISSDPATAASTAAVSAPTTAKTPVGTGTNLAGPAPMTLQHHVYTVVKGDTLIRIAHKFKTTPTALMAANNISDPSKLSIGKKLKIPSKESRSAVNSAPAPAPVVAPQPAQVQTQPAAPTGQLANFLQ